MTTCTIAEIAVTYPLIEQQPAVCADRLFNLFIPHDVAIDPQIL